ncbi:hypothetical protein HJC23_012985 [Cyclotella cryptica]|uniref:Uncharacterized protein n=1 Tax=Cyclotella cryptica TaxID=29204 RepID=A0ABD3QNE5_9STRA
MKYTLILPGLAYTHASAWTISGNQAECVQRCNDLPFKVAVSARRAACIESCSSDPAVSRDPSCVDECNSKRTPRRKRAACIMRCPIPSDSKNDEATLNNSTSNESETGYQTIDLSIYSKDDTNTTVNVDSVSYLNLEDPAFNTESRNGQDTDAFTIVAKAVDSLSNSSVGVIEYWQNETISSNESTLENNDFIVDNRNDTLKSELFNASKEMVQATSTRSFDLAFDENKTNSLNDEFEGNANADVVGTSKVDDLPHNSMVPTNAESTPSMGNFTSHQNKSSSLDLVSDDDDLIKRDNDCVNSCTKKRTLQRKRDACLERCRVLKNEKDIMFTSNDSSSPLSILTKGRGSVKFEL